MRYYGVFLTTNGSTTVKSDLQQKSMDPAHDDKAVESHIIRYLRPLARQPHVQADMTANITLQHIWGI